MVRHIAKPFTVEIRKSGRKPAATTILSLSDPTLVFVPDDQPRVIWPGLDETPERTAETHIPVAAPLTAPGRILLALEEKKPSLETLRQDDIGQRAARPEPIDPGEVSLTASGPDEAEAEPITLVAEQMSEPVSVALAAKEMAATLLRQGRKRLPREKFKRSERWKARLPAAALTPVKVRGKRPSGSMIDP